MALIRALESVGYATLNFLEFFGNLTILAGRALRLGFSGQIHRRNAISQLAFIGVDSLPIALLISLSVGMVFTLQITHEFIKYGATTAIGGVVTIALSRELAPILVSVVVAGRVGSAIAAELGSMKVTEQIDALEAFAVDPVRYLVVPRMLACIIMVPLLTGVGLLVGASGGWLIATKMMGISSALFLDSIQSFLVPEDVFKGMLKAGVFGFLIAVIACHQGLNAQKGAQGVGAATTNSVVYSMIAIFVLNYFLSMVLFPGGGLK
ncbi:MAG: ABC transporter permease [Candidatus Sericytochromatia bacterium]|nr:ABC transporter permease [Candidatus Sericytochromatia bacterium]